ncbi:hypothetical protein [Paraburkholderia tuberum]|uniref:hypothetical protein n=1 Tax=Paraburkholderia TaxID=1822464 RepID=UPI001428C02A|nr:hypothetical protein [Paraburkholderia tuberum]
MSQDLKPVGDFDRLAWFDHDGGRHATLIDGVHGQRGAAAEFKSTGNWLDAKTQVPAIPGTMAAAAIADPQQQGWKYSGVPTEPIRDLRFVIGQNDRSVSTTKLDDFFGIVGEWKTIKRTRAARAQWHLVKLIENRARIRARHAGFGAAWVNDTKLERARLDLKCTSDRRQRQIGMQTDRTARSFARLNLQHEIDRGPIGVGADHPYYAGDRRSRRILERDLDFQFRLSQESPVARTRVTVKQIVARIERVIVFADRRRKALLPAFHDGLGSPGSAERHTRKFASHMPEQSLRMG